MYPVLLTIAVLCGRGVCEDLVRSTMDERFDATKLGNLDCVAYHSNGHMNTDKETRGNATQPCHRFKYDPHPPVEPRSGGDMGGAADTKIAVSVMNMNLNITQTYHTFQAFVATVDKSCADLKVPIGKGKCFSTKVQEGAPIVMCCCSMTANCNYDKRIIPSIATVGTVS